MYEGGDGVLNVMAMSKGTLVRDAQVCLTIERVRNISLVDFESRTPFQQIGKLIAKYYWSPVDPVNLAI